MMMTRTWDEDVGAGLIETRRGQWIVWRHEPEMESVEQRVQRVRVLCEDYGDTMIVLGETRHIAGYALALIERPATQRHSDGTVTD